MAGKLNFEIKAVTTQTPQAVAELLKFCKRPSEPMPSFVELNGSMRLTRSKKGDCYYVTSLTDCSCKARTFNPGTPCKHMKSLAAAVALDESRSEAQAYQAKQRALKGSAIPTDSIIERKPFRPFIEDETRPARRLVMPPEDAAKAALPSPLIDTTTDTNPREVAYHEIMETRQYWPLEA